MKNVQWISTWNRPYMHSVPRRVMQRNRKFAGSYVEELIYKHFPVILFSKFKSQHDQFLKAMYMDIVYFNIVP